MSAPITMTKLTQMITVILMASALGACGGSSDNTTSVVPPTPVLATGASLTIANNEKIMVPKGTAIKSPAGNTLWILADTTTTFNVPPGSVLTAPAAAKGAANFTVTAILTKPVAIDSKISVLAGSTTTLGAIDATGTAATFAGKGSNMAVDPEGNVIAWDDGHIRKITPLGVVTTLPVTTLPSNLGLNFPDLAIDATGNLFLSFAFFSMTGGSGWTLQPFYGQGISEFTAGGLNKVFKDSWEGSTTQGFNVSGLAVDSSSNLFLVDGDKRQIIKFDPMGGKSVFAGSGVQGLADGTAQTAKFDTPSGLVIDGQDNLYTEDSGHTRVRKIARDGVVTTLPLVDLSAVGLPTTLPPNISLPIVISSTRIAVDGAGNIYKPYGSSIIRQDVNGNVTVFPVATSKNAVGGLVADKFGNVYLNILNYAATGTLTGSQFLKISFPK